LLFHNNKDPISIETIIDKYFSREENDVGYIMNHKFIPEGKLE